VPCPTNGPPAEDLEYVCSPSTLTDSTSYDTPGNAASSARTQYALLYPAPCVAFTTTNICTTSPPSPLTDDGLTLTLTDGSCTLRLADAELRVSELSNTAST